MNILKRFLERTFDFIEKQMKIGAYCQIHREETQKMPMPTIQPFVTSFLTKESVTPVNWEEFIRMVSQTGTQTLRTMK
jgi:hypothetical protein